MSDDRLVLYADADAEALADERPLLTVLNFSGGKQSSAILWMVLRGDLPRPDDLLVLHADPGMEDGRTYDYVASMFAECRAAGIPAFTVDGPNLFHDLTRPRGTRIDNPPFWTLSEKGKRGRLVQKCTKHYKIAPMDRALRLYLDEHFGISAETRRPGYGIVEKWIGFSYDEVHRMKPPSAKYQRFAFPLVDLKLSNADVIDYLLDNDLPVPPRSVCNACFANGLDTFREMHATRPADWAQAVAVDRAVRDWQRYGVNDSVFVSAATEPLEDLAAKGFRAGDDYNDYSCDSGYCFV